MIFKILKDKIDYRLPKNIKPESYELTLQPYIGPQEVYGEKAFSFDGTIDMVLICEEPTNKIIFHARELTIYHEDIELESKDDKDITFDRNMEYDEERLYYTLQLSRQCKKGARYTLTLQFSGKILDKLIGFYRSSYVYNGITYQ